MNKYDFKIDVNDSGVSIWHRGRWIVDASTIQKDGKISLDLNRMQEFKQFEYMSHKVYKFDDTYDLKQQEREIKELKERLFLLEKNKKIKKA
jgi:hypothetical protein